MKRTLSLLAILCAASIPLAAHADTVFDFSGILDQGTLQGTVGINTLQGTIDSLDITIDVGGVDYYVDRTTPTSQGRYNGTNAYLADYYDGNTLLFQLVLPQGSLDGFKGSAVCALTATCSGLVSIFYSNHDDFVESGTLSLPATVTPEPSTVVLLASGVLGVAMLAWRRTGGRGTLQRVPETC